jgi:hypothetical protein
MRIAGALALAAAVASAACSGVFRQYEYEEDLYLSLDGTATLYVNSSIAALDALRGASFDPSPVATVDRAAVREYFSAPFARVVGRVATSRRSGRRFVHVRIDVDDVRNLDRMAPFAWSKYEFRREGDQYRYDQTIGPSAAKPIGDAGWSGREIVAFRLHLPSKIAYHNALPGDLRRGNILVWEQPLADRLRGVPLALEARMETESILHRTVLLFAATMVAVAIVFVLIIWRILRRGAKMEGTESVVDGRESVAD